MGVEKFHLLSVWELNFSDLDQGFSQMMRILSGNGFLFFSWND